VKNVVYSGAEKRRRPTIVVNIIGCQELLYRASWSMRWNTSYLCSNLG
jgi:hypothetical protein